MASKIPGWIEALTIRVIKEYLPASAIAEAFESWKSLFLEQAKAWAADTDNMIDDMVVAKLEAALTTCTPDSQFLCDLVEKGEDAVISLLRGLAAKTETGIDDALVDLIAAALKA